MTSRDFAGLCRTSRDFAVLRGTSRYFAVLRGTSWDFAGLRGISRDFAGLGPLKPLMRAACAGNDTSSTWSALASPVRRFRGPLKPRMHGACTGYLAGMRCNFGSIGVGVIGTPRSWPSQAADARGVMDAKKTEGGKRGWGVASCSRQNSSAARTELTCRRKETRKTETKNWPGS